VPPLAPLLASLWPLEPEWVLLLVRACFAASLSEVDTCSLECFQCTDGPQGRSAFLHSSQRSPGQSLGTGKHYD
jgi:hypothetical protein